MEISKMPYQVINFEIWEAMSYYMYLQVVKDGFICRVSDIVYGHPAIIQPNLEHRGRCW